MDVITIEPNSMPVDFTLIIHSYHVGIANFQGHSFHTQLRTVVTCKNKIKYFLEAQQQDSDFPKKNTRNGTGVTESKLGYI